MFIKTLKKLISFIKGGQAVVKKRDHTAANLTYEQWLRTLPKGVVEDMHGKAKAKILFDNVWLDVDLSGPPSPTRVRNCRSKIISLKK